jgi:c-di-GMP-binding flagellar brake protein YcgR
MIGRRRIDKRVSAHPPVQATARRVARRTPVQIMARFSAADSFKQVGEGVALDLSERGCKLCSTQALSIGHFRALYLTIPETSRLIRISEFRVIWAAENEYGIEFLHITAREQAQLRHFIWKKQMNRFTLKGKLSSLTIQDHSSLRRPQLKTLP